MIFQLLKPVIKRDSDPFRRQIYQDLKRRSPFIRFVESFYKFSPAEIKAVLLFGYGMKSFLDAPPLDKGINCLFNYQNEKTRYEYLGNVFGQEKLTFRKISARNVSGKKLFTLILNLRNGFRFYQFLKSLTGKFDFLVSCRISSSLFYYSWFDQEIGHKKPEAVLLSSEANPYAIALMWAARKYVVPSIYVPHGQVAPNPPALMFDICLLDGKALLDTFAETSPVKGKVIYKGADGEFSPLRMDGLSDPNVIGIFLSIIQDNESVSRVISEIAGKFPLSRLLVRLHPNHVVADDSIIKKLSGYPGLEFSKGRKLEDDIKKCNLIFCGNSGTHLEALRQGVPTIQVNGLDNLPHDVRKFICNRVVPWSAEVKDIDLNKLRSFYDNDWINRIRYYDHYYGRSRNEIDLLLRSEVTKAIAETAESARKS